MTQPAIPVLGLADVGDILDVGKKTISQYMSDSRPGRRYEGHPFPAPDGYFGKSPWWARGRRREIERWADERPGRGYHR